MRKRISRNEISTVKIIDKNYFYDFHISLYLYQISIILDALKISFYFLLRERISQNEISTVVKIISTIFAYNYLTRVSLSNFDNVRNFLFANEGENKSKWNFNVDKNYSFYDFRNIYYKFKIVGWAKLNIHANNYKFYKREVY